MGFYLSTLFFTKLSLPITLSFLVYVIDGVPNYKTTFFCMARAASHRRKKQTGPRKRHYCFTSYRDSLPTTFDANIVRYCCYQREICPETKRSHWQGYIEFFDNKRMGPVKKILHDPGCHLEPRQGSRTEARAYCSKKESAVFGTHFEFGQWREDVSRKRKLCDMLRAKMTLDELVDESPVSYVRYHRGLEKLYARRARDQARIFRDVVVQVFIGPTGCGKTRRSTEENEDHFFCPCSSGHTWFDGYETQECLIIDDFYGNIKYGLLLRILDGHELQLPVKGGFIWALWTKVVITSNNQPSTWYKMGLTPALRRRITTIIQME